MLALFLLTLSLPALQRGAAAARFSVADDSFSDAHNTVRTRHARIGPTFLAGPPLS
eukprot:SAG11_NODE_962_length_6376_cov_3.798471_3_plen_56_part_00